MLTSHLGLEAAVEGDDEGVVGKGEDVSLSKHLLHLVPQHQVVFEQLLEGEALACLLVTHQVHRPTTHSNVYVVRDQVTLEHIFLKHTT